MSHSTKRLGRRALAALVSLGMVTAVTTFAPEAIMTPALAAQTQNPENGTLSVPAGTVAAGSTVTVKGMGFAPRTEGQGLAVFLQAKDGTNVPIASDVDGTIFNTTYKGLAALCNDACGVITSEAALPNATNNGDFTFKFTVPANTAPGDYTILVKSGKIGEHAPHFILKTTFKVTAAQEDEGEVEVYFGQEAHPDIEDTAQGSVVAATFQGLPAGAKVTAVGVLDANNTIADNWAPAGSYVAAADTPLVIHGIQIPANAPIGKAISATYVTTSGKTEVVSAGRNGVTPNVGVLNADMIESTHADLVPGLYQSAFNAKDNILYVTYLSFFVNDNSGILKVNPDTLKYTDLVNYDKTQDPNHTKAVLGAAFDPDHDTIWTSSTIGHAVNVFKADGTHIATLPLTNEVNGKNKAHPRDIVIDSTNHKAYVGDAAGPGGHIYVFDTNNVKDGSAPESTIAIDAFANRGPMEIKLDKDTQTLWTVGFNGEYVAKIELNAGNKVTAYPLNNDKVQGRRGAGVAIDTKRGKVYAATQEPSHVQVLDIKTGKIVKTIVTGASPIDALYDPVKDVVYTINRLGGTVNVIDPDTYAILATKKISPNPNYLSTDGKGNVFITTKATGGDDQNAKMTYKTDTIWKVSYKKAVETTPPADNSSKQGSSNKGDEGSSKDKQGSSSKIGSSKDKNADQGSASTGLLGSVAVVLALLGALCYAFQTGALAHVLPALHLPGIPK